MLISLSLLFHPFVRPGRVQISQTNESLETKICNHYKFSSPGWCFSMCNFRFPFWTKVFHNKDILLHNHINVFFDGVSEQYSIRNLSHNLNTYDLIHKNDFSCDYASNFEFWKFYDIFISHLKFLSSLWLIIICLFNLPWCANRKLQMTQYFLNVLPSHMTPQLN